MNGYLLVGFLSKDMSSWTSPFARRLLRKKPLVRARISRVTAHALIPAQLRRTRAVRPWALHGHTTRQLALVNRLATLSFLYLYNIVSQLVIVSLVNLRSGSWNTDSQDHSTLASQSPKLLLSALTSSPSLSLRLLWIMACHREFCNTFPLPAALLFLLWTDKPNSSADQTPHGHPLSPWGARGWSQRVFWKCNEECSLLWKEKGFRTWVSCIWRKERAEKEEVTQEGTTRQEQGRRKCLLVVRHRNGRRASERKNVGNKDSNKATKKGCVARVKGSVQGWKWTLLERLVQEPGLSMPCGVSQFFAVTRQCRGGVPSQTTLVWITAMTPTSKQPQCSRTQPAICSETHLGTSLPFPASDSLSVW